MAVSNQTIGQTYACNGTLDTFAIPFDYRDITHIKVYKIEVATGIMTLMALTGEYTYSPDSIAPTAIVTFPILTSAYRIRIQRETPITQTTTYIDNSQFLAQDHETGLDKIVLKMQEIASDVARSIKVSIPDNAITTELPKLEADKILVVDSLGTGVTAKAFTEIASISGGGAGVPPGGNTGSVLSKASATDGDATWVQHAYSGYSARFSQVFNSTDLADTLTKILNITYTAPTITLTASGSGTVREKGASVASTTLTATVGFTSNPIAEVRFYLSPSTLLDTRTGTIPSGGVETYSYSTPFTDTTSFYARVDDTLPTTVTSSTVTFTFVYPYYYGAGGTSLTPSQVASLTKDVIVSTATKNVTFTAGSGEVFYFAYPASYPALTSILDVNNFETIGDWTASTISITGLDATSQSYRQYKFNNPVVAGSYYYSFRR